MTQMFVGLGADAELPWNGEEGGRRRERVRRVPKERRMHTNKKEGMVELRSPQC